MIRVLLVEDNAIVRQALGDIIASEEGFEVIGLAENGLIALDMLNEGLQADVILADLNMPGMDGIKLTEALAAQSDGFKVIILTMHSKATYLDRAILAGARGYLLKSGDVDELFTAIKEVSAGKIFIGADMGE